MTQTISVVRWTTKPAFLVGGMYDSDLCSVIASLYDEKHWDNHGKSVENDFFRCEYGNHIHNEFPVFIHQTVKIGKHVFYQFFLKNDYPLSSNSFWWTEAKNVRIA